MPAPTTTDDFLSLARRSGLLEEKDLDGYLRSRGTALPRSPAELAAAMVRDALLTTFQAGQLLKGKSRGFIIAGKYKLLEHLGAGGMATVFLCEHVSMHRRVAIKVLPPAQAKDPGAVERFYREARAVATLDHPNLVRAHDIDHQGDMHFLVMEYVEGSSLQDIVRKHGPLSVERAAHYVRQAAVGLDHAHGAGLVHRDIKPGNILVDRSGTVKILDMGLARFFHDEGDDITKKFDESCVLGTADYCAPEQALNSHEVDIRADIYSLGATFYFLLAGRTPFGQGTTAQKIIWHQVKEPTPIRELQPEVPEGLAAVLARMMAKQVEDRYQTPAEVYEALEPWTPAEVAPPTDQEMPRLCPRSQGPGSSDPTLSHHTKPASAIHGRPPSTKTPAAALEPTVITARPRARGDKTGKAAKAAPPTQTVRPPRRPAWLLPVVLGGAALLLLTVGGFGLWWALSDRGRPVAAGPQPADPGRASLPGGGPPRPAETTKEAATPTPVPTMAIKEEGRGWHVQTPKYEAVLAADGHLTNLKIGGVEFFKPDILFGNQRSRGAYLFAEVSQSVLSLPELVRTGNVITASGDQAAVRHVFEPSALRWSVTNKSKSEQRFYIVFDKTVRAVTDGKGAWAEVPPNGQSVHEWPSTTWFAGSAKLTLEGGTRIWGQWPDAKANYQVWQLTLPPGETHEVTATVGEATPQELQEVARITSKAPEPPPREGVTIKADKAGRTIRAARYEARVENDGCVTSLKVGGVELLQSDVSFSRGSYFFRQDKNAPLPMPEVDEPAGKVVTAKGELSSARYEFAADGMTWTLTNTSDKEEHFFLVFTTAVTAVTNGTETVKTPTGRDWTTTTWHFGKGRLKITGSTALWGPWPTPKDNCQVWDARVDPHETRKVVFQVLDAADGPTGMSLQAPHDYQVFQRQTRLKGDVVVRGAAPEGCEAVEARLSGGSLEGPLPDRWQPLPLTTDKHDFSATLSTPAGGWYKLEVRALRDKKEVARGEIEHVGVGEVFVIAGQSNSTNSGEERLKTTSRLVSSFGGQRWQLADDPQPGTHDNSSGGSAWPAFGDALVEKYRVPIGLASTGQGGSSINDWKADGDLFNWLVRRTDALGPHGFRAILWHQGEADGGLSADDYAGCLSEIIKASRKAAGWEVPWLVAQASYQNPAAPQQASVRAGQKKLWDTKVALEGPDTDALGGDNRDQGGKGIHFSNKGLHAHGRLWADKVSAYLDKSLGE
jgi:serine/threonine protein kinase